MRRSTTSLADRIPLQASQIDPTLGAHAVRRDGGAGHRQHPALAFLTRTTHANAPAPWPFR